MFAALMTVGVLWASGAAETPQHPGTEQSMNDTYTIAAYYFPNYHPDARNAKQHGEGWTEWELVKNARPRFEGHRQPNVPLWGYTDESNPEEMARKIAAAADHGIDAFIFDWYWFDDGPNGGCRVPERWQVLYKDGDHWRKVDMDGGGGVNKDRWNDVSFKSVKTTALRLQVRLQKEYSGGILEWRVKEVK